MQVLALKLMMRWLLGIKSNEHSSGTSTLRLLYTIIVHEGDLMERGLIKYVIICSVIGGVLLLLLITFICYKCIGARNRKSFALGDTPAAQYDMEDFSLTKMNRPKPIYTDRGLIINTDLNVPPRPLSGYSSPTAGGAANSNHRSSSEQLVESGRAPHNAGHDNLSFSSEDMLDPSHVTLEESALRAPPRPAASSRM